MAQDSKPIFINPTKEDASVYAGQVNGVQVSLKEMDDGTLGVDCGDGIKTFKGKSNSFGSYWIVDIKDSQWLVSFGTSKAKNNPYAKLIKADRIGGDGGGARKGPAQFGKR